MHLSLSSIGLIFDRAGAVVLGWAYAITSNSNMWQLPEWNIDAPGDRMSCERRWDARVGVGALFFWFFATIDCVPWLRTTSLCRLFTPHYWRTYSLPLFVLSISIRRSRRKKDYVALSAENGRTGLRFPARILNQNSHYPGIPMRFRSEETERGAHTMVACTTAFMRSISE